MKGRWVEVLDHLEQIDRVAWLAFFDARLAELNDGVLTLDFTDADKLAGGHDMRALLPAERIASLEGAITAVCGAHITCRIAR